MSGFTYRGVHSSKFNVEYIPDPAARWFASPEFDVYQQDVAGQDGGYYYGNNLKIRTFELKCFYENITEETREDLRNWLDRNGNGKLIFDEKPFAYYNVRPARIVPGEKYSVLTRQGELHSGTFTITFAAYDPFGYLMYDRLTTADIEGAGMYSGILHEEEMPATPATTAREFLIYNCGTQPCDTVIQIGGTGTEVNIANETNGSFCSLVALPATGYLEIDGHRGKVTWVNGNSRELFFEYHDEGYLDLAPFTPKNFHVNASYTVGSSVINIIAPLFPLEEQVGRYIWLAGGWHKITAASAEDETITIADTMTTTSGEETKIVTMNEIKITGTNLGLNRLSIAFSPVIY